MLKIPNIVLAAMIAQLTLLSCPSPVLARQKVTLVLGGGGARCAAHVGVLKVLIKEKVPIDMIVGTSMGAVVGGFYAAGVDPEQIGQMYTHRKIMKKFTPVPVSVRLISAPFVLMFPRLVYHPYDGLYYNHGFRKFLEKQMPPGHAEVKIEELKIPFAAVGVDLSTGEVHAIRNGKLSTAMAASSAIPGLRKPVQIGDHLYIDGGTLSNLPIPQAMELGEKNIILAVTVDEPFETLPLERFRKMGSVSRRVVALQIHALEEPNLMEACIVVSPDVKGIKMLSTRISDVARAIVAGEKAAEAALPKIRKCLEE